MIKKVIKNYLKNIEDTLASISTKTSEHLAQEIIDAKRLFVFGAGRSGLVGKAFAMRLMHLGKEVFFIGETITPAVEPGDALFFISGSGNTLSVVNMLKAAKEKKIRVLGLSSCKTGALYKKGDHVVQIDTDNCSRSGDYLTLQLLGSYRKITPLGTSFESSALVYLDSLIVLLMAKLDQSEEDLKNRHANLE